MNLSDMLERIKDLLGERKYLITTHAIFRMSDRGVSMEDLISLIAEGEIIEAYPDRKPCPAALMLGFISDRPLSCRSGCMQRSLEHNHSLLA